MKHYARHFTKVTHVVLDGKLRFRENDFCKNPLLVRSTTEMAAHLA